MSSKQTPAQAEAKEQEKIATGKIKDVQITNGSGEVKRLSPAEWKERQDHLLAEGWVEMGADD